MTGAIYFNQAELMGYSNSFIFFGDNKNYSNSQNYTIKSYITGSKYLDSISEIFNEKEKVSNYVKSGICNIYVNNIYIGDGKVNQINFEESTDTRKRNYSASISIQRLAGSGLYSNSGYIDNTGIYFSGSNNIINYFSSATGRYIKNFSLEQNCELISSGKYSYSKSSNFSIDPGIKDEYGIETYEYAKNIFSAVAATYGNEFILSQQYPDFYTIGSGISRTSQSFDIYNNSYSYDENFLYQVGLNYMWRYSHSLNYDGNIISISENGTITSTSISGTRFQPAIDAWYQIESGVLDRCLQLYSGYTGALLYSGGCGLSTYPTSTSLVKDFCKGKIDYSKNYSTNPFLFGEYSYSYSDNIDYLENGYIKITENGSYKAIKNATNSGLNTVISAYNSGKPSITGRISGLYSLSTGGYNYLGCQYGSGIKLAAKTETYNEYNPEVSYTLSFTDDPSFVEDDVSYLYKTTYSDSKSLHSYNYFPTYNNEIIPQSLSQSTRGKFSNLINIIAKSGSTLDQLVSKSLSLIKKPSGTDIYSSDFNYSYSPLTKNFTMGLDYVYSYYRNKEEFLAY